MSYVRSNPRVIDYEISMLDIDLDKNIYCKYFNDPYTNSDVAKSGCFGCENLKKGSYRFNRRYGYYHGRKCSKDKAIRFIYVRKDENGNICLRCPHINIKQYLTSGCDNCTHSYNSQLTKKCRKGFDISQEIFPIIEGV